MKFQVREGFVLHLQNRVEVAEGKFQTQEINFYGGQVADLSEEQADLHAHKLEPKDKAATDYLASKQAPVIETPPAIGQLDVQAIVNAAVTAALAAQAAAAKTAA